MIKKVKTLKKTKSVTTQKKITRAKKPAGCVDYHADLIERLKDPEYAMHYLNAAIEESLQGDEQSQSIFLMALKNVAQACGTMASLARKAHMRRESLYRMLCAQGNPELQSLTALLHAMGFVLHVRPR